HSDYSSYPSLSLSSARVRQSRPHIEIQCSRPLPTEDGRDEGCLGHHGERPEDPMSSNHHDLSTPGEPQLEEVSDRVYAYIQPDGSWYINNTGFLVGDTGVTCIDACATERRTLAYLDTIAEVSDQPVRTLVNTHHHGDHTHGNFLFSGATIVAHELCREELMATGAPAR